MLDGWANTFEKGPHPLGLLLCPDQRSWAEEDPEGAMEGASVAPNEG
jgi:hypothetical protein